MPFPEKTRHLLVEDVEWLIQNGESNPERIAVQLKKKPAAVARALYREGRPDLAAPFNALAWRTRQQTSLCAPCKNGLHQAHRKHWHSMKLCRCGYCKTVTDSVRGGRKSEGL